MPHDQARGIHSFVAGCRLDLLTVLLLLGSSVRRLLSFLMAPHAEALHAGQIPTGGFVFTDAPAARIF